MADSAVKVRTYMQNFDVAISSVIVAFVLAGYAVLGFFVRPEADDFCFAVTAHYYGIVQSVCYSYQNWLGRFSQVALTGAFSYLGPYSSQLSPLVLLFGLVTGTWYALRSYARHPLCLALVGVYAFAAALPLPFQTLYWQSAAHTYIAPLVVAACMFGLLFRHRQPALIAVLGFFACGFNEGISPVLLAGLGLLWLIKPDLRPLTAAAIAGVMIGTLTILTAPGNFNRSAFHTTGPHPPIVATAYLALREGLQFFLSRKLLTVMPLLLTGLIAVRAFPQIRIARDRRIVFILVLTLAAISLSGLNLIPALWAGFGSASERVYTANSAILVMFIAAGFVISGIRLPNRLIILITIIAAASSLYMLISTATRLIPYAREFDKGHLTDTYAEIAQLQQGRQPGCYYHWSKIWCPEFSLPNR
jgi:hypothetical protein